MNRFIDGILHYKQTENNTMVWREIQFGDMETRRYYDYMNEKIYGQCCLKSFSPVTWVQKPRPFNENTIFLEFLGTYQRTANDKGLLEVEFSEGI